MADGWDQFQTAPQSWDDFKPAENAPKEKPKFGLGRWAGLTARNAIAGAASIPATLLDIPAAGYNLGADVLQGKDKGFRFNEMNQNVSNVLTNLGLPQPETGGERVGSDIARTLAGGGGSLGLAQRAQRAAAPVARGIAHTLATAPGRQGVSAGLAGGAAGLAREADLPAPVQIGAGLLAGAVPYAKGAVRPLVVGGAPTAAEARALDSGFVIPPASMEKPSQVSKLLGGWAGKIKSQQGASAKNQKLVQQMAASELGLPRDTTLDDTVLSGIRQKAGTAYERVKKSVPTINVDDAFRERVSGLGSINSDVAEEFPELVKNDAISNLATGLAKKDKFSTAAGVEAVKILRSNATKNLQALGDPEKHALGFAQRDAADAIDDLLDRNISATGDAGTVGAYKEARRLIAKSYDIESATNTATGEINPRRFALLAQKGKPLSGDLSKIADAALTIPKSMQVPSSFGGVEPMSILDIAAAAGGVGSGNYGLAGIALGRPLIRNLTLSDYYQQMLRNGGKQAPLGAVGMFPAQPAALSNTGRNNGN